MDTQGQIHNVMVRSGIAAGALIIYSLLWLSLSIWQQRHNSSLKELILKKLALPGAIAILFGAVNTIFPALGVYIHHPLFEWLLHGFQIVLIGFSAFFLMRVADFISGMLLHRIDPDAPGYAYAKAKTKYTLLQRVYNLMVITVAVVAMLITFNEVRKLGTAFIASAGVVGIIIGFAAQKSLGTLFSGIVIAIAEPIRLGDVVVVEGEYGSIAEINLTFVVVQEWDGRNLIVPINYFLEKSFQSWTRISPEVIGQVKLYVDYSVPVDELRAEFNRLIESTPLWDKRVKAFEVTNTTERSVELRGIMSAKNPDDNWNMEVMVREQMIKFIRAKYPDSLPRTRYEGLEG